MVNTKMHDNEVHIDVPFVRHILNTQYPEWSNLPIKQVQSVGTDNVIYRLGIDMCVRLPRVPEMSKEAENAIEKEHQYLHQLAPMLPLAIPIPLKKGAPTDFYPGYWSIYHWLEGENATDEPLDLHQAAIDLAHFLKILQKIDPAGGPFSRRGVPLIIKDKETCKAIKSLDDLIDTKAATIAWKECLQAPEWRQTPVWTHGDLLPGNLLVQQGKLSAVIDFGLLGIGDPACDLIPAWSILCSSSRKIFRTQLGVDDATWKRGQGWALSIALIILPYYRDSNPGLVAVAKRMLNEVLSAH